MNENKIVLTGVLAVMMAGAGVGTAFAATAPATARWNAAAETNELAEAAEPAEVPGAPEAVDASEAPDTGTTKEKNAYPVVG